MEEEVLDWFVRGGLEAGDLVAAAMLVEALFVLFDPLLVGAGGGGIDDDCAGGAGFGAVEFELSGFTGIPLDGIGDVEDGDLVAGMAEAVDGGNGIGIVGAPEVAEEEDEAAAGLGGDPEFGGAGEGGGTGLDRGGGEEAEEVKKLVLTAGGGENGGVGAEDADGDAVEVGEGEVAKAGCEAACMIVFDWVAVVHGAGGIDEEVDVEIFFFDKEFEHELSPPGIGGPIDQAEIIPWGVGAVFGEFDTVAVAAAAAFGALTSPGDLACGEGEGFEAAEKGGVEEIVDLVSWHGSTGSGGFRSIGQ